MPSKVGDALERARQASETGDVDTAYKIANAHLKRDPNDAEFLTILVHSMLQADKTVVAYSIAKHVCELRPKAPNAWLNLGKAAADLWQTQEAIRAYKKSIRFANNDKEKQLALVNMCAVLIDNGKFDEAEPYARTVLEMDPDSTKARANLGFCQLAQRNWKEGWDNYRNSLGSDWRPKNCYFGEPEWDGTPVDKLIVYAEQGIGDVIGFASMIPDTQKVAKKIIFECDAKLEGLMKRSFPDASVYGTRYMKELPWAREDVEGVDASVAVGSLGGFFRPTTESFPGTAYLTPDPDRVFMWKSLFESKKKPVIGVSWRGGLIKTAAKHRQWNLEQLVPIFKSVDAHWVSLQYKPAGEEIAAFKEKYPDIDLVEYPHGTLTPDYDDTAAMVAAMDHLVCMQSAVTHLAGALGKPVWVFVPQCSQWRYGGNGEDYVWSKSVRIMRQTTAGEWSEDIDRCASELKTLFSKRARTNGKRDHRKVSDKPPARLPLRENGTGDGANASA